jgi:hypothetical protein
VSELSRALLRTDPGDPPRLALRPKEAALSLGLGTRKLWEITADQTSGIPHCRFGKCVVYPVRELVEWLGQRAKAGDKR